MANKFLRLGVSRVKGDSLEYGVEYDDQTRVISAISIKGVADARVNLKVKSVNQDERFLANVDAREGGKSIDMADLNLKMVNVPPAPSDDGPDPGGSPGLKLPDDIPSISRETIY